MDQEPTPSDHIAVRDAPPLPGLTFRRYRGEGDLPSFVDVYETSRPVDGFSWIMTLDEITNQYEHLLNTDLERDVVVVEMDDQVIGYSQQNWVEELEAIAFRHQQYLVPEWRGKGIRRAMLAHCEERAREVAAAMSSDKKKEMSTWLCEDETGWTSLLEERGHAPVRYFHEMVRDLRQPIEDRPLPVGLEVRPVPEADHRKVFFAANEALKDHWAGREWTEEDYQEFMNDPVIDPAMWVVAYDGDEVAGTVLNWIHHEENERMGRKWGYTEIITVRRPYRSRGLAKALITISMRMLRDLGMEEANLGVDTQNPSGALGLYTGLGYRNIKTYMIHRKGLGV
ncbi:MAG: GNAT family N-acetyltransferase [Thermoplasmata archaeon]|nr:MAG: GNAT family N-acetyltransferase [Thermoplasmata archaeon]